MQKGTRSCALRALWGFPLCAVPHTWACSFCQPWRRGENFFWECKKVRLHCPTLPAEALWWQLLGNLRGGKVLRT